ncbi:TonB-dependent receptor plug domain-containing protein [Desulfocurvus sp. DL9XJH121]
MHILRISALLALALFLSLPASAADKDAGGDVLLEPVIVTARGMNSTLSSTPGGVGVADREDILLSSHASVADALGRVSGVSAGGESAWGRDVIIRGLGTSSVVVLIDGMRVNTATDLNARLGFINPQDVERVEVLKGPISALYGSGSTGGVVNIITKKGSFRDESQVHGEVSNTFSTNTEGWDGYARGAFEGERLWVMVSGGRRAHDDYRGGEGETVANSDYQDNQARLSAGFRWTDDVRTEMQLMVVEAHEVGIPGGSSTMPKTAPVSYPRTGNVLVGLHNVWDADAGILTRLELDGYMMRNDRRARIEQPTAAVREISTQAEHETWGGNLRGIFEMGEHTLVAGAEAWNWRMASDRRKNTLAGIVYDDPIPNASMLSMGVYAEDDWAVAPDWTLNAGARADQVETSCRDSSAQEENTETDTNWNAHLGLTWEFAEHWTQSLIGASSFRSADIMERYKHITLGGGKTLEGNPALDPEKSWFAEYSLRYADETLRASANVFGNWVTDLITEEQTSPTVTTMANVGTARILGLELDAHWRFAPCWSLYGNVAFLHGEDTEKDQPLRTIPPVNGTAGLRFDADNGFWTLAEAQWATCKKVVPDDMEPMDGWMTANLAAGLTLPSGRFSHEFALRLSNLLDKRYVNYLANSRGIELVAPGSNAAFTYTLGF